MEVRAFHGLNFHAVHEMLKLVEFDGFHDWDFHDEVDLDFNELRDFLVLANDHHSRKYPVKACVS